MYFYLYLGIVTRAKKTFFRLARKLPVVARKIEEEMGKAAASFGKNVVSLRGGRPYIDNLPSKGLSDEKIIKEVQDCLNLGKFKHKPKRRVALQKQV